MRGGGGGGGVRASGGRARLQDRDEALEAHACIDGLGGERPQFAARLAVELHEHQVPHLEHVRVVHVHQGRGVAAADAVVVDLRAWTARPRVAHLPEVVLLVARQHTVRRKVLEPELARLG